VQTVRESIRGDGYYDQALDTHLVSVMAGVYHWTRQKDIAFSTTLGSCLSVCAFDRYAKIGGMNHFLLPQAPEGEDTRYSESFRYGSAAIETLLNSLYNKGAAKNGLMIKIFGGAKVLNGLSQDVGRKNVDFAHKFFKRENLRVESEDVGGLNGRRVIFFPMTGKVLLRSIGERKDIDRIAENEIKVMEKITQVNNDSDVELF
tara:strand:+ start:43078 stop:43686 length:609 start_codon:yes stop_codon:yes gene_type:complete